DGEIAELEGAIDRARVGMEVAPGNWAAIEGVDEDALEVLESFGGGVDGKRTFAEIAKAAAIVEAHDVIGMGVGDDDGIEPADVLAEALEAEFRGGIDDELDLGSLDIDGGAKAMVFGVGEEGLRVIP